MHLLNLTFVINVVVDPSALYGISPHYHFYVIRASAFRLNCAARKISLALDGSDHGHDTLPL
jgi:hypothetical protein